MRISVILVFMLIGAGFIKQYVQWAPTQLENLEIRATPCIVVR